MGFFDIFTGDPAADAAEKQRLFLDYTQRQNTDRLNTSNIIAQGDVQSGANAAGTALGNSYNTATGAVNSGTDQGLGYLDRGAAAGRGQYDAARDAYAPLSALGQKYGGATSLALNSLGVNGAGGQTAARDAFKAGPAYNFNLDQGLEAINRRRNMGGMLASGNADRDAQEYGAGLASNEYDKWMSNLLGFTNPELQATSGAASGISGVDVNQAGSENALGLKQAGMETMRGAMLSDLASKYGNNLAGINVGTGNTLANLQMGSTGQMVNLAQGLAAPYANTYGQQAAAQTQGNANAWNLATSLGKSGVSYLGSQAGGAGAGASGAGAGAGAAGAGVGGEAAGIGLEAGAGEAGAAGAGEGMGAAWAAMFSDRRLKTDIKRVGTLDNGLPVYLYRYIGDSVPRIGLMADEVATVHPEAVHEIGGYDAVNYEQAVR